MILKDDWHSRYKAELTRARSARLEGNEGMARVCARRAAGIVIGEFLLRRGLSDPGPSAYDRLTTLKSLPDVNERCKVVSEHFLVRVNPDHNLPLEVDLVSEAEWLAQELLTNEDH